MPTSESDAIDVARYAERERARLQAVEQQWRPLDTAREKERQQHPTPPLPAPGTSQPRASPPAPALPPGHAQPPPQGLHATSAPPRAPATRPRLHPLSFEWQQWPPHKLVFDESPVSAGLASPVPTWPADGPVWQHASRTASGPLPAQLLDTDGPGHWVGPTTERARYEPVFPRSTRIQHPRPRAPASDAQQRLDIQEEDSEDDCADRVGRRRTGGVDKLDEEAMLLETLRRREAAIRLEQGARAKDAAARRKEEAVRRKELEALDKEADLVRREEEVRRREEELNRRDAEAEGRQRQDEFRRRVDEIRRHTEERKRQGSYWKSRDRAGFAAYASASSAAAGSPWPGQPHSAPSNEHSEGRNSSSSSWSGTSTRSAWSSARPGPSSSRPKGAWVKTTPSSSFRSGGGAQPAPLSESQWTRRQEEQAKARQEQFRVEQERLERDRQARAGRALSGEDVVRLFEAHHRQWAELYSLDELRWDSFPWPTLARPAGPDELTASAVGEYVLSPHYPVDAGKSAKERIKEHIKRWHPDRFETKLLPRVVEGERERVKHGAGLVARCLNELLTRSNFSAVFS